MIKVGTSQVDITPKGEIVLAGSAEIRRTEKVYSRLYASALIVDNSKNKLVFISLDILFLSDEICEELIREIADVVDTPMENVIICCTHTHNAQCMFQCLPQLLPDEELVRETREKIIEASKKAAENMLEVKAYYASANVPCSFNRRTVVEGNKVWVNPGPQDPLVIGTEGPEDQQLQLVWFETHEKGVAGIIANYSAHPTHWLYEPVISADCPGEIRAFVQKALGSDTPVLYLQGACGNTSAIDFSKTQYEKDFDVLARGKDVGEIIGRKVLELINEGGNKIEEPITLAVLECTFNAPARHRSFEDISLEEAHKFVAAHPFKTLVHDKQSQTARYEYNPIFYDYLRATSVIKLEGAKPFKNSYPMKISACRIGDVVFVTNPGELFVEYQLDVKEKSPFSKTIVIELANGYCGYIITEQSLKNGGYETYLAVSSYLAPSAGEIWVEKSVELLNKLDEMV